MGVMRRPIPPRPSADPEGSGPVSVWSDRPTMRVLVLSALFPSATRPTFGVFVRERVRHLRTHCAFVVVAPIPWFPFNRWVRGPRANARLVRRGGGRHDTLPSEIPLPPGTGHCVEHYVKLNTPGLRNGIYRGWVDGELVFEKTDFVFRKVAALAVESIWMNVYHGGTTPVDRTVHLYIDNLVIATSYIVPMHGPRIEQ